MSQQRTLTALDLQRSDASREWRVLAWGAATWYAAPSHRAGAGLARRLAELDVDVDIRADGVCVRIPLTPQDDGFRAGHLDLARAVSEVAADLGLTADPAAVQDVQLAMDTLDPTAVMPFWQRVLGYDLLEEDVVDPHRRTAPIWFQEQDAPRPLRNRLHVDVVTPHEVAVSSVGAVTGLGGTVLHDHGYYATVGDPEGNEADLLPLPPGADRWESAATEDWRLVFAAVACYRTSSPHEAADLAEAAAALADEAGLPLGIDLRPGLVVLATAKDAWEMDERYEALAARVQEAARDLGLRADPALARFVQVVVDAVDIAAVRRFWQAALGYRPDQREGVTDIVDPRQLNLPLVLQPMDASETDRRAQRNRIHLDVFVPDDELAARVEAAVAAGGTIVRDAGPIWWTVADPEGNEVDLTTAVGREEQWAGQQG
ncbi:VOC family protein [Ornithinimicrobium tianjinense]|uniref:Glyoxalase-like domain-containing protein n=1 Tax=Ornithinimicrobium tianjinense TaxID=1195761 RepID=A0A917BGF6_9MICO|nr:VOC family protein [Ornithinimicrobium tianjinense]GGF43647.1 hypothetical protein GCM10011366_09300 [Ornithinimicrobium tianjinense]